MVLVEPDSYMLTLPGSSIAKPGSILLLTAMGTYLPVTAQDGCEQSRITFQAPEIATGNTQPDRDVFYADNPVTVCCILCTTPRTGPDYTASFRPWFSLLFLDGFPQ